jgi:hypothetical protein
MNLSFSYMLIQKLYKQILFSYTLTQKLYKHISLLYKLTQKLYKHISLLYKLTQKLYKHILTLNIRKNKRSNVPWLGLVFWDEIRSRSFEMFNQMYKLKTELPTLRGKYKTNYIHKLRDAKNPLVSKDQMPNRLCWWQYLFFSCQFEAILLQIFQNLFGRFSK